MERVGRGGTQGGGGAGGGASPYDQALKSLNEQWLQMRFTTQGKPPSLFMHATFSFAGKFCQDFQSTDCAEAKCIQLELELFATGLQ
jgi:hypothetical protein